jgi:hypothetical protein
MDELVETTEERKRRLNRERKERYKAKHPERVKESDRRHRLSGKKKISKDKWLAENPEKGAEYTKRYRENNPEKTKAYEKRRGWLRNYGITPEEYEEILNLQGRCCKICNEHESAFIKSLAVDHDHKTGKVRGLLCSNCNTALGLLRENLQLFDNAVRYLKEGSE